MHEIIYELKNEVTACQSARTTCSLLSVFFCRADFLPLCLSELCLCCLCQSEHQTLSYSQTECGKGKCPYDPFQKTASSIVGKLKSFFSSNDSNKLWIISYHGISNNLSVRFYGGVDDRFYLSKRQMKTKEIWVCCFSIVRLPLQKKQHITDFVNIMIHLSHWMPFPPQHWT